MYGRFVAEMPAFLRQRITPASARATIAHRLASREINFLRVLERGVFARKASPYLFLFREAGCEFGDAEQLVKRNGVDAALAILYDRGVRLSFDEFKGRAPLTRGGRSLDLGPAAFDNPLGTGHYETQTSGSTGTATRVNTDLAHVSSVAPNMLTAQEANGMMGSPVIMYGPGLPCATATNNILRQIITGNPVRRWFSPVAPAETKSALRFRTADWLIPALVRAWGSEFPRRELVPFAEAVKVARAAAALAKTEGRCLVRCAVSTAHTVALAAVENRIDLSGITFNGGGEPPSAAKVKGIIASGARYVTSYSMNEAGLLGVACARGVDHSDVHFLRDRLALVERPQPVPGSDHTVAAFSFTSLLLTAPKILINVESDDFGILEERQCGCLLGEMGFQQHIRQVRSLRKLTGRGITLVGADIARIIEEDLPARFGGSSQDFQLVEEEDHSGATRLVLLVSPSVPVEDNEAPAAALLDALARGTPGASLSSAILRGAGAIDVRREKPQPSAHGKLPVFRTTAGRR
jgi:hypothetical protein